MNRKKDDLNFLFLIAAKKPGNIYPVIESDSFFRSEKNPQTTMKIPLIDILATSLIERTDVKCHAISCT
jgi:hypothetical protein